MGGRLPTSAGRRESVLLGSYKAFIARLCGSDKKPVNYQAEEVRLGADGQSVASMPLAGGVAGWLPLLLSVNLPDP